MSLPIHINIQNAHNHATPSQILLMTSSSRWHTTPSTKKQAHSGRNLNVLMKNIENVVQGNVYEELIGKMQVTSSKEYRSLAREIQEMQRKSEQILKKMRNKVQEKKVQVAYILKEKEKIKGQIWGKIQKICRVKQSIQNEKDKQRTLLSFLNSQISQNSSIS